MADDSKKTSNKSAGGVELARARRESTRSNNKTPKMKSEVARRLLAGQPLAAMGAGIDAVNNWIGTGLDEAWDHTIGGGIDALLGTNTADWMDGEQLGSAINLAEDLALLATGVGAPVVIGKTALQNAGNFADAISGYDPMTGQDLTGAQRLGKAGSGLANIALMSLGGGVPGRAAKGVMSKSGKLADAILGDMGKAGKEGLAAQNKLIKEIKDRELTSDELTAAKNTLAERESALEAARGPVDKLGTPGGEYYSAVENVLNKLGRTKTPWTGDINDPASLAKTNISPRTGKPAQFSAAEKKWIDQLTEGQRLQEKLHAAQAAKNEASAKVDAELKTLKEGRAAELKKAKADRKALQQGQKSSEALRGVTSLDQSPIEALRDSRKLSQYGSGDRVTLGDRIANRWEGTGDNFWDVLDEEGSYLKALKTLIGSPASTEGAGVAFDRTVAQLEKNIGSGNITAADREVFNRLVSNAERGHKASMQAVNDITKRQVYNVDAGVRQELTDAFALNEHVPRMSKSAAKNAAKEEGKAAEGAAKEAEKAAEKEAKFTKDEIERRNEAIENMLNNSYSDRGFKKNLGKMLKRAGGTSTLGMANSMANYAATNGSLEGYDADKALREAMLLSLVPGAGRRMGTMRGRTTLGPLTTTRRSSLPYILMGTAEMGNSGGNRYNLSSLNDSDAADVAKYRANRAKALQEFFGTPSSDEADTTPGGMFRNLLASYDDFENERS